METKASLRPGERIHLGLMDAICSRPGTVMPWVELCALFKDHGILSLVDAAHLMGHMPVSLTQADPDFWVSNAHKWCFAPRSLAVLHVGRQKWDHCVTSQLRWKSCLTCSMGATGASKVGIG